MYFQVLDFCQDSASIWSLVGTLINIVKIVIPIIIVILAMLDLGKAITAGEDKEIKDAQKLLVKRLVYGVLIFFVVTIVQVVFGLINERQSADEANVCWACAVDPNGELCQRYVTR